MSLVVWGGHPDPASTGSGGAVPAGLRGLFHSFPTRHFRAGLPHPVPSALVIGASGKGRRPFDVTSDTDNGIAIVNIVLMAHQYPNILIHCVFSTKERKDLIPDALIPQLCKYFAGIGRNRGMPVLAAGGISNHFHLLIALPTNMPVAKAIQILKANSSRWVHEHGLEFAWQEGYGAFSVSSSNLSTVQKYIEHQPEHHHRRSYEGEFEAMLRKSGIAFDPKEAFG